MILFVHIPKTAGTTLRRIVERIYPTERIHRIYGHGRIKADAMLDAMLADPPPDIAVISGHVAYYPGCQTLTMLRHPVDRVISSYHHITRHADHPLHAKLRDLSLPEALPHLPADMQVSFLAATLHPTPADLETAIHNLTRTTYGLTERFDESVLLMRRALGWPWPVYRRVNAARRRPDSIPDAVRVQIAAANPLDIALYEYAVTHFDANPIRRQLPFFQAINQVAQWGAAVLR